MTDIRTYEVMKLILRGDLSQVEASRLLVVTRQAINQRYHKFVRVALERAGVKEQTIKTLLSK